MKLRFKYKPRGQRARSRLVNVPGKHLLLGQRISIEGHPRPGVTPNVIDISADFIAAFEARHAAEVLEIRRPYRRGRA